MTEDLQTLRDKFTLHWGEMGTKWGINRTMAQVHALLFISEEALSADQIMEELKISRGSVSMSLRDLISWGIVSKMHIKGERKEFYTTEKDVWKLFKIISRERKKREIDPTIAVLNEILAEIEQNGQPNSEYLQERVRSLLELVEIGDTIYNTLDDLNAKSLIKMSSQVLKLAQRNHQPETGGE
jgi:DNA-binding transcriptional regulator GbsR (MarR family)